MALPRRPPGVDAQMPAVRGGLCRLVHRHRRFRLNCSMDPNSNAGALFDLADVSCCQILAQARSRAFFESNPRYQTRNCWPAETDRELVQYLAEQNPFEPLQGLDAQFDF